MHYDVIVVGSGAGGGTLACALGRAGRTVLLIERGDWLPQEPENWDTAAVFQQGRYVSRERWLDGAGKAFQPQVHYYVGGATKLYGAALYRLRPEDFGTLRHADGLSPAWPISYAEMEPWYTAAEQLYGVRGNAGEDCTEGPRSKPYPFPALEHEPRIGAIAAGLRTAGYNPFHTPNGVHFKRQQQFIPRPAADSPCIRCATCDGFPCQRHAKADAEVNAVRPALQTGRVTILTGACVSRLYTDRTGQQVTAVEVVEDKLHPRHYSADVVVLAAGAVNTAALLLRSGNDHHPRGLANVSDQVGRNYMCHVSRAVMAITREPNLTTFQKTMGLNDWYLPSARTEWPLGNVQMLGKSSAAALRGERPHLTRLAPEFTLTQLTRRAVDFWLMTEDLPQPANRVTVRDEQIQLTYRPSNLRESMLLYRALRHALRIADIGLLGTMSMRMPLAACAHQAGTARMGRSPQLSVVDRNCQAWDLTNLYIADASVMPTVGAVNPALTVMANALRVADHISRKLTGV